MQVILYNNSSDNATLEKSITEVVTISNVLLMDNTNILNPSFKFALQIAPTVFNYLFCRELNRYYYITNITILAGGIYQIDCAVDVLMSYKDAILSTTAIITRSGTKYNVLINDGQKVAQANTAVVNKQFIGGELLNVITADNVSFLLTCYGGVV